MSTDDSPNQTSSLSIGVKSAYGFGSVAYGVNNVGFDYFLLLFYSQVIGLDARLVGVAIIVALVCHAVIICSLFNVYAALVIGLIQP